MPADRRFLFSDAGKRLAEMDGAFRRMGLPLGFRCVPWGSFAAVNLYEQGGATVPAAEVPGVERATLGLTLLSEPVTLKERHR